MTIRLVMESGAAGQPRTEIDYHGGELVIGRGDDADWRVEDPEMFVSRRHCVISDETGEAVATDASSGGLFVDGSDQPLGPGNSVTLNDGMRLRLGDFVLRVDMAGAAESRPVTGAAPGVGFEFDFGTAPEPEPERKRPSELPDPFQLGARDGRDENSEDAPAVSRPLDQFDPFALDLKSDRGQERAAPDPEPAPPAGGLGGYFSSATPRTPPQPPVAEPEPTPAPPPQPEAPPVTAREPVFEPDPVEPPRPADPPAATPAPPPASPPRQATAAAEAELRAAFIRGLGIDPASAPSEDPVAEMEALGRRFRSLVEGVTHLLQARAKQKQTVRVAQTLIGARDVNPLKFLVTTDEAVAALVQDRGSGYLSADDAIPDAYRDLADHQIRTWSALQTALRRMIDRFDPEEIERDLEDTGVLEALLAGGRSAKLWQLYQERYKEIARAAEERFLGEVGADFRDAYEDERS